MVSATATMGLAAFLAARLDEDEQMARAVPLRSILLQDGVDQRAVGFVIRYDPSRALAEVVAKRRILWLHGTATFSSQPDKHLCEDSMTEHDKCDTLRALASVYADHPNYRQEWS